MTTPTFSHTIAPMVRALFASLVLVLLSGCATGTPVGAQAGLRSMGMRPFGPASEPRAVPATQVAAPSSGRATKALREGARDEVVRRARAQVGHDHGRGDCTSLVLGVYQGVGVDLLARARPEDNGVTAIYRFASSEGRVFEGGRPLPGDLVFFRDTYDQNRDGRLNDGLTHVGLVESIEPDGTVVVIHRVSSGVVRYRMNLEHRHARVGAGGARLNDYLRGTRNGKEPALAGQLFAAYATVLPAR